MSHTQEYLDCDFIISRKNSSNIEVQNFYNTVVLILNRMATINADTPRRAKFDTLYGKIDSAYNKNTFDAYVDALQELKTYLEDEGWIPEE